MKRLFLFLCLTLAGAVVSTVFLAAPSASASVATAGTPAAVTRSGAQSATPTDATTARTTRDDPAASRLRMISYGLVGLALLILVMTAIFWRVTRPPVLLAGAGTAAAGAVAAGTSARRGGDAASVPEKIPAAVVLASPLTAAVPTWAPPEDEPPATPPADATDDLDAPPADATPDLDAPPPIAGQPLGAQPLVGNDTAWIIEPDSESGLIAETPKPTDFPERTVADLDSPVGASARVTDAATPGPTHDPAAPDPAAAPSATESLIAALAALPDIEPTVVRFDDPPVQRVRRRSSSGAPGFDRAARESAVVGDDVVDVAEPQTVVVAPDPAPVQLPSSEQDPEPERETVMSRRMDDMALMASALRSLPQRELDFPPTGEFYDQDLDAGDPPGRDR